MDMRKRERLHGSQFITSFCKYCLHSSSRTFFSILSIGCPRWMVYL